MSEPPPDPSKPPATNHSGNNQAPRGHFQHRRSPTPSLWMSSRMPLQRSPLLAPFTSIQTVDFSSVSRNPSSPIYARISYSWHCQRNCPVLHELERQLPAPLYNSYQDRSSFGRPNQNAVIPYLPNAQLGTILDKMRVQKNKISNSQLEDSKAPSTSNPKIVNQSTSTQTSSMEDLKTICMTDSLTKEKHFVQTTDEHFLHHLNANCAVCKLQESIRVGRILRHFSSSFALIRTGASNLYGFQIITEDGNMVFGTKAILMDGLGTEVCICGSHKMTKLFVLTKAQVYKTPGFLCPIFRTGFSEKNQEQNQDKQTHPNDRRYLVLEKFEELYPKQNEVDLFVLHKQHKKLTFDDKSKWVHPLVPPEEIPICELTGKSNEIYDKIGFELQYSRNIQKMQRRRILEIESIVRGVLATENMSLKNRQILERVAGLPITMRDRRVDFGFVVGPTVDISIEGPNSMAGHQNEELINRDVNFVAADLVPLVENISTAETAETGSEKEDRHYPEGDVVQSHTNTFGTSDTSMSNNDLDLEVALLIADQELESDLIAQAATTVMELTEDNTNEIASTQAQSAFRLNGNPWMPLGNYNPPEHITLHSAGQSSSSSTSEESRQRWKTKKGEQFRKTNKKEVLELTNFNLF